jgi:hypothetical protein
MQINFTNVLIASRMIVKKVFHAHLPAFFDISRGSYMGIKTGFLVDFRTPYP